jgi:hypothetical protein
MSSLEKKGLDAVAIKRDSFIKKIKADIRKANYRLACIAAQEKLNADKVHTKTEKLAAKKNTPDKPSAKIAKGAPAKKEKKERKRHLLLRMSKSRNRLFILIFIDPCQLIVTSGYHG